MSHKKWFWGQLLSTADQFGGAGGRESEGVGVASGGLTTPTSCRGELPRVMSTGSSKLAKITSYGGGAGEGGSE